MDPSLLHVVTAVANPMRWKSRIALYHAFERHMVESGVRLTTVECAFGDRPFVLGGCAAVEYVRVRASAGALVWNKESLLNIGIARLPASANYIATLDADIRFRRADWAVETVHALQHYPAVQPWADCYDLGPHDEHLDTHVSFARLVEQGKPIVQGPKCGPGTPYRFGHPGYAWGWTRQALEWAGGLIETAGLGAGDHHMAMALIGRVEDSVHGGMTPGYVAPLRLWQSRVMPHIAGSIGFVPGTIEHGFHGPKDRRAYVSRWNILAKWRFDPATDLKRNAFGVVELAGNKPGLRRDIDAYFRQRDEDLNSAG